MHVSGVESLHQSSLPDPLYAIEADEERFVAAMYGPVFLKALEDEGDYYG